MIINDKNIIFNLKVNNIISDYRLGFLFYRVLNYLYVLSNKMIINPLVYV